MPVSEDEPFYNVLINLCAEERFSPNVILAGAEYTTVFRLVGMGMGCKRRLSTSDKLRGYALTCLRAY